MRERMTAFPDKETLRERILGSLYGGALGDALGYVIEFDSWRSIQSAFGREGISDLVPIEGEARFSDDTQMTLFTAEGMKLGFYRSLKSETKAPTEWYIYQAYLCWLQTQGYKARSVFDRESRLMNIPGMNCRRAPGNTCLSALLSGEMGTIDDPLNLSKGCGGVMRTAPLGFVRSAKDGKSPFGPALMNGAKAAAVTHGNPLGWIPAGMLSDVVDRCVYGNYGSLRELISDSLEAVADAFPDYPQVNGFKELIERAMTLAERPVKGSSEIADIDEPAILSLGEGWVGDEALAIAVYAALRYENNFRRGITAAVNHRGDSDSTGAIAGNILGAYLGKSALPSEWIETLELKDEIAGLAEDIIQLIFC